MTLVVNGQPPGGGGALDPDAVWDAVGSALDDDPTRAPGLATALAAAPISTLSWTGGTTGVTSSAGNGSVTTGTEYGLAFAGGTAGDVFPTTSHPRHAIALSGALPATAGRWRVTARIASAPDDSSYRMALAVGRDAVDSSRAGVQMVVVRSGAAAGVELGPYSTGYAASIASGGSIPVDGTGWVRMTYAGGRVTLEWGTGTTTAQPSSWTSLGTADVDSAPAAVAIAYLIRWGGSNGLGGAWDGITVEAFA